jgi:NAD(P)-dependent dehydrogenase (short-subunit alcohol dehydrogenase family)
MCLLSTCPDQTACLPGHPASAVVTLSLLSHPCLFCLHPLQLCSLVLKGMKQRGRGVVINVGSGVSTVIPTSPLLSGGWLGLQAQLGLTGWAGAACVPFPCMGCCPLLSPLIPRPPHPLPPLLHAHHPALHCSLPSPSPAAVYAGSKAFIDCLSRSLDAEYRSAGVRVQNQAPMFVATKMSKIRWGEGGSQGARGEGREGSELAGSAVLSWQMRWSWWWGAELAAMRCF